MPDLSFDVARINTSTDGIALLVAAVVHLYLDAVVDREPWSRREDSIAPVLFVAFFLSLFPECLICCEGTAAHGLAPAARIGKTLSRSVYRLPPRFPSMSIRRPRRHTLCCRSTTR